jgi:hypothetical protein
MAEDMDLSQFYSLTSSSGERIHLPHNLSPPSPSSSSVSNGGENDAKIKDKEASDTKKLRTEVKCRPA